MLMFGSYLCSGPSRSLSGLSTDARFNHRRENSSTKKLFPRAEFCPMVWPMKFPVKEKAIFVGIFGMSGAWVALYALPGERGGSFDTAPLTHLKQKMVPKITVGIGDREWWMVVETLLHEAAELALVMDGLRWQTADGLSRDHASYLFVLDHCQFCRMCARTADFITAALPELAKAYKRWRKIKP
jgi:hypothetical protein